MSIASTWYGSEGVIQITTIIFKIGMLIVSRKQGEYKMTIFYICLAVLGVISVAATLAIGNSKENNSENDTYTKKSGSNILRLSYLNIVSLAAWVIIMIVYFVYWV
jgi:hypothetical protein